MLFAEAGATEALLAAAGCVAGRGGPRGDAAFDRHIGQLHYPRVDADRAALGPGAVGDVQIAQRRARQSVDSDAAAGAAPLAVDQVHPPQCQPGRVRYLDDLRERLCVEGGAGAFAGEVDVAYAADADVTTAEEEVRALGQEEVDGGWWQRRRRRR